MSLLAGKNGLIMGVANDHSIAYGIAQHCARAGHHSHSPIRMICWQNGLIRWRNPWF